jgi:hypothetical protein
VRIVIGSNRVALREALVRKTVELSRTKIRLEVDEDAVTVALLATRAFGALVGGALCCDSCEP